MPCEMVPGQGPTFRAPLENPALISSMLNLTPDVEQTLGYVFDAVHWTRLRVENKVPVIGFSGAPWTLLAYMIEGGGSKTWSKARKWLYLHKAAAVRVMKAIADVIIEYLVAQYDAGASILQVFDTNAGECPPHLFRELVVPELKRIAVGVKGKRPEALLTVFAKDAPLHFWEDSVYDVVGVSWKQTAEEARNACPSKTLQGNLDPAVMYGAEVEVLEQEAGDDPDDKNGNAGGEGGRNIIAREVARMRSEFGAERWIANLGHGMMPDLLPKSMQQFIEAVKSK
eukprot:g5942.t1